MNIQIVRPLKSDLPEIKKHLETTISESYKIEGIFESAYDEYLEEISNHISYIEKDFSSDGTDEYFLLAKSENIIVGTIGFGQPNAIIKKHLTSLDVSFGEIKTVYINPSYQNKNIGSKLFDAMLHYIKSINQEQFVLDCGFKQTQPFWIKKLGPPTLILENYYQKEFHHMIWESNI